MKRSFRELFRMVGITIHYSQCGSSISLCRLVSIYTTRQINSIAYGGEYWLFTLSSREKYQRDADRCLAVLGELPPR